jgi:hypothetical protein
MSFWRLGKCSNQREDYHFWTWSCLACHVVSCVSVDQVAHLSKGEHGYARVLAVAVTWRGPCIPLKVAEMTSRNASLPAK